MTTRLKMESLQICFIVENWMHEIIASELTALLDEPCYVMHVPSSFSSRLNLLMMKFLVKFESKVSKNLKPLSNTLPLPNVFNSSTVSNVATVYVNLSATDYHVQLKANDSQLCFFVTRKTGKEKLKLESLIFKRTYSRLIIHSEKTQVNAATSNILDYTCSNSSELITVNIQNMLGIIHDLTFYSLQKTCTSYSTY